jgi:hypothetical protein
MRPLTDRAVVVSLVSLACALVASVVTLAWDGSFPPPAGDPVNGVLAEARGWSAVTAFLALPLGVIALRAAARGSLRGRVVWAGIEVYLVYTYLEIAVSPPFSALYLLYVATFATAIPAALMAISSVDAATLAEAVSPSVPRRGIALFALTFPIVLAGAWLSDIVPRLIAGDFGYPTGPAAVAHVVHALDLGLQVPLGIAAGLLLLRREPAGWWVGGILLVQAVCMAAALTAMVGVHAVAAGDSAFAAAPFAGLFVVCLGLAVRFLRGMEDEGRGGPRALAAA